MNSKTNRVVIAAFSAVLAMPLLGQAELFTFDPSGTGHGIANFEYIDLAPGNALVQKVGDTEFQLNRYQANLGYMGGHADSSPGFSNGTGGNFFTFAANSTSFALYAATTPGDNSTGTGFITGTPILQAHLASIPVTMLAVLDTTPVGLDRSDNGNQTPTLETVTARGASYHVLVVDSVNSLYFPSILPHEGILAEMSASLETPFNMSDPTITWAGASGLINGSGPNMLIQMDTALSLAAAPGVSPATPILPIENLASGWQFDFMAPAAPVFVDPLVAVGYDYLLDSGPNFTSVRLPSMGDDQFALYLWDGTNWMFDATISAGTEHFFGGSGVDRFRIADIEPSAGLDPNSPTAFVTELTFAGTGPVGMHMIPLTQDVSVVSEPGTLAIIIGGLGMMGFVARRHTAC
ncbi:PEP-CTERM protein-sorting domain-containing protein [Nitrosospira multiformis]|uniref:PEP-CTERM protein-sorting domain-containing protein n=1 Tax=Nitrosospira multiformis TaxID=1231 RepID=A0A1H8BFY6_9PROT|nr:PEP-CTERM sorting domain-containing protein [Nitrosospira multiformis]SEM81692.1 PEP-CTERM protein-sorting domain-containing protein [Nitrosospira multiformis]